MNLNPFKKEEQEEKKPDPTKYANGRIPKLGDWVVHNTIKSHLQITSLQNRNFSHYLHEEDFGK